MFNDCDHISDRSPHSRVPMPALFRALHLSMDNAVCTHFGPAVVKLPRGFHGSKVLDSVA
jgi:hypothetical protein